MKTKLLSFILLFSFMGAINAADDVQPTTSENNTTPQLAEHSKELESLKAMVRGVIAIPLLENAELKKQLGLKPTPFLGTQNFVYLSIDKDNSLTEVQFVEAIFSDFRKWRRGIVSALEQENNALKEQLARIKVQKDALKEANPGNAILEGEKHQNIPISGKYKIEFEDLRYSTDITTSQILTRVLSQSCTPEEKIENLDSPTVTPHAKVFFTQKSAIKITASQLESTIQKFKEIDAYLKSVSFHGFTLCLPKRIITLIGNEDNLKRAVVEVSERVTTAFPMENIVLRIIQGEDNPAAFKIMKIFGMDMALFQTPFEWTKESNLRVRFHGDVKSSNIITVGTPSKPRFTLIDNGTLSWPILKDSEKTGGSPLTDPVYFMCCSALLSQQHNSNVWDEKFHEGMRKLQENFYLGYISKLPKGVANKLKGLYNTVNSVEIINQVREDERKVGISMISNDFFTQKVFPSLSSAFNKAFDSLYL